MAERWGAPDRRTLLAGLTAAAVLPARPCAQATARSAALAFPGAQGWAATTPGGRGGAIVRVTTLATHGAGSLQAALAMSGPRVIVFEVGGVIDLAGSILTVREPFCTIAGQTAPNPGITLIRGGLVIAANDVIVRHLRVRPGSAGFAKGSGWECDAINVFRAHRVVVDHCSLSWGTDENLSASGPRFDGDGPVQWRERTASGITFSNCIVSEGLAHSTHSKGEHSKGTVFNYNVGEVLVVSSLYASNRQRNPLFGGGARGAVINNLIHNPGTQAVMLSSQPADVGSHSVPVGIVTIRANVLQPGPSTKKDLALLRSSGGSWRVFIADNMLHGDTRLVEPELTGVNFSHDTPFIIPNFTPLPVNQVRDHVLKSAGARPWARDLIDARIVEEARTGAGMVIDDQNEVGGYPAYSKTTRLFNPVLFSSDSLDIIDNKCL